MCFLIVFLEALQTKSPSGKLERARPSSSETYMASSSRKRVFSEAEKKGLMFLFL